MWWEPKDVVGGDFYYVQRMQEATFLSVIDCTGHGWIGFFAGAEYRMGTEARSEFGESMAPVKADKRTMGNTLYKAVFKDHRAQAARPDLAPGVVTRYDDRARVTRTGGWANDLDDAYSTAYSYQGSLGIKSLLGENLIVGVSYRYRLLEEGGYGFNANDRGDHKFFAGFDYQY